MFNNKSKQTDNLKYQKIVLHIKYIVCICIAICAISIVAACSDQDVFIGQLSMASTLTSIVLSVVAIIMSISGEGKTEGMRNQMLEITNELHNTVNTVNKANAEVEKSIEELRKSINILHENVEHIPDVTAQRLSYYNNDINVNGNELNKKKDLKKEDWIENEHKYSIK